MTDPREHRPLRPWQRRWVADDSRFKTWLASRRIGKTYGVTFELVRDVLAAEGDGRREDWLILCPTERVTRETMETGVGIHLTEWNAAYEAAAVEIPVKEGKLRGVRMETKAGSRFIGLPGSKDAARGFGGHVYLDEYGFHRDPDGVWAAVFPVVTGTNWHRLLVSSTATEPDTRFHKLMTDPVMGRRWSRHECDIHRAVREGLDRDVDEMREALGDEVAWQREFECQFVVPGGTWLTQDAVARAEFRDAGVPALYAGNPVVVGMDLAARRDFTIIVVLEILAGGELLVVREVIEMRGALFRDQIAQLGKVRDRYDVMRIAVDQSGIGEMPVQEMQIAHGPMVEGVIFTADRRMRLATLLRERMANLRIPPEPDFRRDLLSVRRATGPTGAPRLVVPRTALGHADRFWALALAVAAAEGGPVIYEYQPAGSRDRPGPRSEFDEDNPGRRDGWGRGAIALRRAA